ncbi:MAG: sugar transferase [Candidatus Puniceispirillales bacterium]
MSLANTATAHQVQHGSTHGRRLMLSIAVLVGYALVMVMTIGFPLGEKMMSPPLTIQVSATFLLIGLTVSLITMMRMAQVSIWNMQAQILPIWASMTVIIAIITMVGRLPYSSVFFALNWVSGLILLYLFSHLISHYAGFRIGVLPGLHLNERNPLHQLIPVPENSPLPEGLDAVVASAEQMQQPETMAMLSELAIRRVPVIPDTVYREQITGRVQLDRVETNELVQLQNYQRYAVIKRLSDIIMSLAGLLLLLPLMIILALIIRLESPGNPIFVQVRTGLSGREFRMYKFRSMVEDADASGARFARTGDDRVTRTGRIIRHLRLDELPQLYNVLIGDMSMIGPRPEQKALVDDLARAIPLFHFRHLVRPGITGWAQVTQGYADDVNSSDIKLSYDLFYIKNLSLMMDFVVFFRTLKTIMTGFGSR